MALGVTAVSGLAPPTGWAQRQAVVESSVTAVSCQVITPEDLEGEPTVARALQGRVPGLELRYGSGQVGAGTRVNVRGVNSLRNSPPLVFVDGILTRGAGGDQDISILDQLNPTDIQLIEVFRGPAATTLWGTDAAGGVIRVYTKHGNPRADLLTTERARCVP